MPQRPFSAAVRVNASFWLLVLLAAIVSPLTVVAAILTAAALHELGGRIDGKIIEMPLKTKNAYRTLPLSADAISVLMQQRRKTGNSEWVFPSPTGGPMSPDSVLHMLHRVLRRAGLPKVRFHDLRHTFATLALQNGVDIKTVSGMLGHFSAGFTLDTYAHVTTSAKREAAKTMGNILSGAV